MMSLFADDAMLTDTAHENKVYRGKEQVRTYWADVSGHLARVNGHWLVKAIKVGKVEKL
jgi:hypothetical protein